MNLNSPSHPSDQEASVHVHNYFDVYRYGSEAIDPIPAVCEDDPVLDIGIAAAYANNGWIYGVWLDGALVCSGGDPRSGSVAHTHLCMAAVVAVCLANNASTSLRGQAGRLGQWADDEPDGERGERGDV